MHFTLIFLALISAFSIRLIPINSNDISLKNWSYYLFLFTFPPLILIMTFLSIICMGYKGEMLGFSADKFSYFLAVIFIILSLFSLLKLSYQGWLSLDKIKNYPLVLVENKLVRIIDISFPYAGQIGFWQSELVITNGLIKMLSSDHLKAVIAHEEAHYNYRDTFNFFWLGYLKNITFWLPNTYELWQELLLMRELRADKKAAEKVDFLLLAESLLLVTESTINSPLNFDQLLICGFSNHRLNERINALLNPTKYTHNSNLYHPLWLLLALLPLLTIPFHY